MLTLPVTNLYTNKKACLNEAVTKSIFSKLPSYVHFAAIVDIFKKSGVQRVYFLLIQVNFFYKKFVFLFTVYI